MNAETTVMKYIDAWKATISLAKSPFVWVPFAILAVLKAVPLVLLYFFWKPSFSGFMLPVIQSVFGERMTHYPMHVLKLPDMYRAVDMGVTLAFGFVLLGWAVIMMIDRLEGNSVRFERHAAPALFFVPALLVLGFVFVLGVQGIPAVVSHVGKSITSQKLQMLLTLAGLGTSLLVKGLLVYCPSYLVLSRGQIAGALGKSWERARTWGWLTAMIVLTGWGMTVPLNHLLSQPDHLIQKWGPGLVFGVLMANILLGTLEFFYLFGSATSIIVAESERA